MGRPNGSRGGAVVSADRPAPGRWTLTAEGHPRTVFRRAIERGNLMSAETAAREMGVISLLEALELTALVALRDRARASRFATRWLHRLLEERSPTIDEAALAASALAALGGHGHNAAAASLLAMAEQPIGGRRLRGAGFREASRARR